MKIKFQYCPKAEEDIKQIYLAGSFNGWDIRKNPMKYNPSLKCWTLILDLPRGDYSYKFLLNGEDWVHDPGAERFVQNDIGSLDSIKRVKPSRANHGRFSPLQPTLDDRITFYSTKAASLLWRLNGWNSFPQNFQNICPMEKNGRIYKYTLGPFNFGTLPEVVTYGYMFKNGSLDDNKGKGYWLPLDLKLGGKTQDIIIKSHALRSKVSFRIYLPQCYFSTEKSLPLMFLIHGYGGTYKSDWTQQNIIKKIADKYGIILVWPDGNITINRRKVPSWYLNSPRIKNARGIAGISMGGYGAFYLASKYNEYFCVACSMSAIYNLHIYKQIDALRELVGRGNWSKNCFNVRRLIKKSRGCDYYFIIGTEEGDALEDNLKLKHVMESKKIPHFFQIYPGNHTNNFWLMHIQEMMEYACRRLGS